MESVSSDREETQGQRNNSWQGQAPGSRDVGWEGEGSAPRNAMGRGIRAPPCHPLQCRRLPWSKPLVSSPTSALKAMGGQSPAQWPHPLKGEITKYATVCLSPGSICSSTVAFLLFSFPVLAHLVLITGPSGMGFGFKLQFRDQSCGSCHADASMGGKCQSPLLICWFRAMN